jgi:hypothetical protein
MLLLRWLVFTGSGRYMLFDNCSTSVMMNRYTAWRKWQKQGSQRDVNQDNYSPNWHDLCLLAITHSERQIMHILFLLLAAISALAQTTLPGGTISADSTLSLAGSPYTVTGVIRVYGSANPRLTIESGVELRFTTGARIEISHSANLEGNSYRGQLTAVGTVANPIRFLPETPGADWGGLRFFNSSDFSGASSQLEFCEFEGGAIPLQLFRTALPELRQIVISDATGTGLLLSQCVPAPLLENLTITGCGGHGLSLGGSALPALSAVNISGNGDDRVSYYGQIIADLTLNPGTWGLPLLFQTTSVYDFTNPRLTLVAGDTLRFSPGAVLQIAHPVNLESNSYRGELFAAGTVGNPIVLMADNPALPWSGLEYFNSADFGGAVSQLEHVVIQDADEPLRLHRTALPQLDNVNISCTGSYGVELDQCVPAPALNQLSITGASICALRLSGSELPVNTDLLMSGNADNRVHFGGLINTDLTLDLASWNQFVVFEETSVYSSSNPRLTLTAGDTLRFLDGASLEISHSVNLEGSSYTGQLSAVGTAAEPLVFMADDELNGWQGIVFYNASDYLGSTSQLENAEILGASLPLRLSHSVQPEPRNLSIEGAEDCGIRLDGCIPAPPLENVSVMDCGGFPLELSGSALPLMSNVHFSGNLDNRVAYTGVIEQDLTLNIAAWSHPLVFTASTSVFGNSNPRLTLTVGDELRFAEDAVLNIAHYIDISGSPYRGQLHAVGTAAEPIRMVADDPAAFWNGLHFFNAADDAGTASELQHVEIDGAMNNLWLKNTHSPDLLDLVLTNAADAALRLEESAPEIKRCAFLDGNMGVHISNSVTTVVGDTLSSACSFMGNSDYDLYNNGPGDVLARYNGWCTPSGMTLEERIYDQIDNPAVGLVSYNPTGSVDFLRVTAVWNEAAQGLRLEWCPVIGATSYTVYGDTIGYVDPLSGIVLANTSNTWLNVPYGSMPSHATIVVTAEVPAARSMSRSGACR